MKEMIIVVNSIITFRLHYARTIYRELNFVNLNFITRTQLKAVIKLKINFLYNINAC